MADPPWAVIRHDPARVRALDRRAPGVGDAPLDELPVVRGSGSRTTVAGILDDTHTDAWVVQHRNAVVVQAYRSGHDAASLHQLMSITKSVVGVVAGVLRDRGRLDVDAPVTDYVPELASSGYRGATVRHVLDMRSGIRFAEDYQTPESPLRHMEAHGVYAHLTGLVADRPHGGRFEYRSCETDVLGWVCERAGGARMADLISELVWIPTGAGSDAAMLCDVVGTAVHDGGMSATALDLARFGQVLLDAGLADGRRVVPQQWLSEVWGVHRELRDAFDRSEAQPFLPGGWYRNQCWVIPGPHGDLLLGLGIHGQLLRVDPATRTVIVKLSSWPVPQHPTWLDDTLRACDAVAAAVSGRPARSGGRFRAPEAPASPIGFH